MRARNVHVVFLLLAGLAMACERSPLAPDGAAGPAAGTGSLAAKGNGKPPAPEPVTGTAEIRCTNAADLRPDVICADGQGMYVDGDPGVTVRIRVSDGAFGLAVNPEPGLARAHVVRIPDRKLWDHQDCNPQCVANIPDGGLIVYTEPRDPESAYISAGKSLPGGLLGLADGATAQTNMLIGFPDPNSSSDIRWSLYWDPDYYVGTDWATVSRSGCTWTITAADDALAGFWLFRVGKGKYQNAQEGRFKAPVEITFTANPATVPGGC